VRRFVIKPVSVVGRTTMVNIRTVLVAVLPLGVASLTVGLLAVPASAGTTEDLSRLQPPVDAEVVDPFRMDHGDYGPGNRGIEYATQTGDPVRAAGAGQVVFVGAVAGTVYVSVDHAGGLRSAYGPVAGVRVSVGDHVVAGQQIASAASALHFSTRIDGVYVDPASLFGSPRVDVRLAPHDLDTDRHHLAAVALGERLALFDIEFGRKPNSGQAWPLAATVMRAIAGPLDPRNTFEDLDRVAQVAVALGGELPAAEMLDRVVATAEQLVFTQTCTSPAEASVVGEPAERRLAVMVDGLGSNSISVGIDQELGLDRLGYEPFDVFRFSYAGGVVPRRATTDHRTGPSGIESVPQRDYGSFDTFQTIGQSSEKLSRLLRALRAAHPDVVIDVYGYSLGGVVVRHAVAEVEAEVDLGAVVTIGSPHSGVPAASFAKAMLSSSEVSLVDGLISSDGWKLLTSSVVADLSEVGFAGLTRNLAFPDTVNALTIGGRSDLVVPGTLADAPGAQHVMVGDTFDAASHQNLPRMSETHTAIRLALAGLPPVCRSLSDRVLDRIVPELIVGLERAATVGMVVVG